MFRKSFQLLVVFSCFNLLSVLLSSCRCSTDDRNRCYVIYGISIETIDNGGLNEKPVINKSVYAKALLFRLNINDAEEFCSSEIFPLFMNTAFAMLCKQKHVRPFLSEKSFRIYTNNDFDSLHPSGSDLRDLFVVKGNTFYLVNAPEDTSQTYTFTFEKGYFNEAQKNDTFFTASSQPLKLLK